VKLQEYRRLGRGSAAAVAAIVVAYVAQSSFIRASDLIAGICVFALAGGLMVYSIRAVGDVPDVAFSRQRVLAIMTATLLFGAAMRLWDLASIPQGVWFDEAENGLVATRILTDAGYKPIYIAGLTQLPAMFFYYMAAWIGLIGSNILAVRLASAALGLLTIPGVYLLGRELFGQRVGLTAAFLLSLSRWHINFSRFGMNGIAAPFFIVYSLLFLARGFRTRDPIDFMLGGLCIGLGLNTYPAFAVMPLLAVLWIVHKLVEGRLTFVREYGTSLVLAGLITLMVVLPLAVFAWREPAVFFQREKTASVFTGKTADQARAALLSNVVKHVEMFNLHGDNNGRHNLAGAPELDDGTAALFVLGIIIAVAKCREPRFLLLVLWLVLLALPAVLSLDFEAPQSYRAIGVIPVTALLASVPIVYGWGALRHWLGIVSTRLPATLAVTGLVGIGYANAHLYWFRQIWDGASWPAFSTQETLIAREVDRLGPGYNVYVDPIFLNAPTIRFLAPSLTGARDLVAPRDLPFHDVRNTVVFASDLNVSWIDAVRQDYPNASVTTYQATPRTPPILYEAIVPADQIGAIQGLIGAYATGPVGSSHPAYVREDRNIDFRWSKATPLELPFSVAWKTTLTAPIQGTYVFKLDAPAPSQLSLDETPFLHGGEQKSIDLAQGTHALSLTLEMDAPRDVRLYWQPPGATLSPVPANMMFVPPVQNRGLLGRYYRNPSWSGRPSLEQIDPVISTYFHLLPLPQPFTVEWSGKIDIPSTGLYRFGTQSIDASWLYVDNQLVVDNSHELDHYVEGAVNLTDGLHDIRIRFLDRSGHSFIRVYWQPPGGQRGLLPVSRLFPPQGAYPERAGPLAATRPFPPASSAAAPTPVAQPAAGQVPVTLPISAMTLRRTITKPEGNGGILADPRGVAVDLQGHLFIVDAGNQRVDEFRASGEFVRSFGGPSESDGGLSEPVDAVINPRGEVVVLDANDGWIVRYSEDGAYLGRFGGPPVGFYHPRSIAVDAAGNYYVADTGTGHVVIFDPTGNLVKKVDLNLNRQQASKQIQPVGIAIDSQGLMYVTDAGNYRLTEYDPGFRAIRSWLLPAFSSVKGDHVAVGADGSVYVSDTPGHRIIHIDSQAKLADQIGASGQMDQPVGVASDAAGSIYVVDASARQVLIYGR
jgi:DNA-binding beta-propeller fold protein YncE/4-amino-4-deoxy-L-arabinose transferase-like glycosyltransferase